MLDDLQKEEDVFSTTDTKTSELSPVEEKSHHIEEMKEEGGQGERLLRNGEASPNGHVL